MVTGVLVGKQKAGRIPFVFVLPSKLFIPISPLPPLCPITQTKIESHVIGVLSHQLSGSRDSCKAIRDSKLLKYFK